MPKKRDGCRICHKPTAGTMWLHIKIKGVPIVAVPVPICADHINDLKAGTMRGDVRAGLRLPRPPDGTPEKLPAKRVRRVRGDTPTPSRNPGGNS